MGVMLSILFSYVGAIELVLVVRDVTHQMCLHNEQLQNTADGSSVRNLDHIQARLKKAIRQASVAELNADEQLMQDGVAYENGYRVKDPSRAERAAAERWQQRRKELSSSGSDEDAKNERQKQTSAASKYLTAKRSEETISPQSSMSVDLADREGDEGGKYRPIVRDDGSGRRRAYKKRQQQSSASSTSSGEPAGMPTSAANRRTSREDELKMFTSLEEEEFESMRHNEYQPLQYTNESAGARKSAQKHRHTRRSPAPDEPHAGSGGSDAEGGDTPWGDVRPQPYRESDLWRRERGSSIVEEHEGGVDDAAGGSSQHHQHRHHHQHHQHRQSTKQPRLPHMAAVQPQSGSPGQRSYSPVGDKRPLMASFEEATDDEHELVIDALKRRKHDVSSWQRQNMRRCERFGHQQHKPKFIHFHCMCLRAHAFFCHCRWALGASSRLFLDAANSAASKSQHDDLYRKCMAMYNNVG